MKKEYWHERWKTNHIGWHEPAANPLLVKHFGLLALPPGSRVFVPLCGKTLDIGWLLSQGYRVAGAELTAMAIEQLFAELHVTPVIKEARKFMHYHAGALDIFVGDIFDLSREQLGKVDAVYDRAALVAFPEDIRGKYTSHLKDITHHAPQLMICYDYDQSLFKGPPFSVADKEVHHHYDGDYDVTFIEGCEVKGGLKGEYPAVEKVWVMKP